MTHTAGILDGSADGLMGATVAFLEALYWLDRCGYQGRFSMDQYPYREDAAGAIGESILWLEQFALIVERNRQEMDGLVQGQDAIATSRFLRSVLGPVRQSEDMREYVGLAIKG